MWCSRTDLNRRPPPYQGGALPSELHEHMAPREGLEPLRCPMSVAWRSVQLSYRGILNGNPIVTGSCPESPVSFSLATTSFFRSVCLLAQRKGLEPSKACASPTFQAGRVPIGAPLHVAQDRGFEPLEPLQAQRFSKPPQSAALPILRMAPQRGIEPPTRGSSGRRSTI